MTEYDFSPEAYERYIRGQHRIRRWVHHTDQTPKADPYQAATPAVDVPKELLPHSRLWDSNPPWSAQPEKKPRKHRTHSQKEFDRERRNDWKYSHREHMDALRAASAHPQTSRTKKAVYDDTATPLLPPPLQSRNLHTASRYHADHRLSDSQDTSSSSEYVYVNPINPARKRSSSVQAPIRVPLPEPLPSSMPLGPLPGPMPLPGPTPFYVYGPEANAQVELDDESARKSSRHSSSRRSKPAPSRTVSHLPPPPASAPVYTSRPYQGHNRYYSSSSPFLHQPQQGSQPRPTVAYPYPYAPSPLSPQNSAPAYSYPRPPVGFIPEPLKSSDRKLTQSEPFMKRVFLNFASQRKTDAATGETKERMASKKEGSGSLSQPSTPSPTSYTKPRTWLGSPVKNKLIKTARKELLETPRSKSSLDHRPSSGNAEAGAGTGEDEGGLSRGALNVTRDGERERGRERERDRTREKENRRDERRREGSTGREYKSHERRKERNGREKEWEREKEGDQGRWRNRSRSGSRERHTHHRRDRDRERDDRYRSRHRHREGTQSLERRDRERALDREPEGYKDKDRGRDRTPRHSRPREKAARE